jgi:Icc-related predicted phosphoesterase
MYKRGEGAKRHWDLIPDGTHILVTHGPAYGILDTVGRGSQHLGCAELLDALNRVRPAIFACGHIHGGYGQKFNNRGTHCINASICNENYKPVNAPVVVDLE